MSAGARFTKFTGIIVLVLCLGGVGAGAASSQTHRKTKKAPQPQLPTLPSGPTGQPIPQLSLDSIAPVAPHVTYEQGQLTIIAVNSTLGDVLRAVRKQTGAEIDVPDAKERVVTHLGPGPAQEIIAELLNGSRFNYVLLGSPQSPGVLTRVVLVARSGGEGANRAGQPPAPGQPDAANAVTPGPEPEPGDDAEVQPAEETPDENADQAAAEPEPPPTQPDQPGVKTPQELLQEMQQRQLQMQQGAPGQPPIPGAGLPQRQQQQPQEDR